MIALFILAGIFLLLAGVSHFLARWENDGGQTIFGQRARRWSNRFVAMAAATLLIAVGVMR